MTKWLLRCELVYIGMFTINVSPNYIVLFGYSHVLAVSQFLVEANFRGISALWTLQHRVTT